MNYLSKENMQCMKGIFAVCILIHHLYQHSGLFQNAVGILLQALGYLSVGMFFFFTGYGLAFSFRTKEKYSDTFLCARLRPLYLLYVVLIALYTAWAWFLHMDISFGKIIQSFLIGKTIVCFGWYFQATFLVYLLLWSAYKLVNHKKYVIFVVFVELVLYCVICDMSGLPTTWYESIFCIPLGILWDNHKLNVDKLLKKHVVSVMLLSGILFLLCRLLMRASVIFVIAKMVSSLSFVVCFNTIAYILSRMPIINNKITTFLGTYSLEIYASQGFFIMLKQSGRAAFLSNSFVFILITMVGTATLAYFIKKINNAIIRI